MARLSFSSRLNAGTSSISTPARSMVAGATKRFLTLVGSMQSSSGLVPHDHVVHGQLEVAGLHTETRGGVALGVEIDHEHPVVELGQRRAQVDRRGRLAHPALLVGDGDDPGQLAELRACEPLSSSVASSPMDGVRMACFGATGEGAVASGSAPALRAGRRMRSAQPGAALRRDRGLRLGSLVAGHWGSGQPARRSAQSAPWRPLRPLRPLREAETPSEPGARLASGPIAYRVAGLGRVGAGSGRDRSDRIPPGRSRMARPPTHLILLSRPGLCPRRRMRIR